MQLREIVAAMKHMAELHSILFYFWCCDSRNHLKIQQKQHLKHDWLTFTSEGVTG